MLSPAKALIHLIEFINIYIAVYYANFLFFYLKRVFGFGEVGNLLTAALGGFVYMIASWQAGRYVERYGCIRALYAGLICVMFPLALGMVLPFAAAQVFVFCLWTVGICFIWPALETLISERAGSKLPDRVGLYNITWASGGAIAYFTGGMLLETLGMKSLFWLPLLLALLQLSLVPNVARLLRKENNRQDQDKQVYFAAPPADAWLFLRMAWFANPFCYVAINTVIPLIPSIADKLGLSTGMAGIVCSVWMFARLVAFAALWRWTVWHYRFRWLAGAFVLMIACFFGFLTTPSIFLLLVAEIGFGLSIGLVYYSSLYYSMNVWEKQGANAGLHEAMMGAGFFAGPALGASMIYLVPASANIGAWSVGGLLLFGFSGLVFMKIFKMKS